MKSNILTMPCCYFPTRVVMVDDNSALTESLKIQVESALTVFNHPKKALDYLSQYSPAITEDYWLQPENECESADGIFVQPMTIDTGEIRSLQHDPDKYQDISVVIMDYQMPEINGLDLLSKISDKPFKTILLTGEAENDLAVQAFNQGQIDYFLRKDEDNLGEKLNQIIKKLQFEYFTEMSKKSREIIAQDNPLISNQKICAYLLEKIQQNNITEFYLINLWGNYLLINQQRQKQYFCAYTQDQLNHLAENAIEENAKSKVISDLSVGEKIPFFGENTPYWKVDGEKWEEFMLTPEIISTQDGDVFVGIKE